MVSTVAFLFVIAGRTIAFLFLFLLGAVETVDITTRKIYVILLLRLLARSAVMVSRLAAMFLSVE